MENETAPAKVEQEFRDAFSSFADKRALDELFSATYEELRRLVSSLKRHDPSSTLSPTALVNEACLKLAKSRTFAAESPLHFKRIAARAMRQLLIEAARRRRAGKRDGGIAVDLACFDSPGANESASDASQMLVLDEVLAELARVSPRRAAIVELRFFGGLDVAETATALAVSEPTVLRDWRVARAWLSHQLRSRH
jgi:RNA polymerase sigma factor (TIGR02999 family)